MTTSPQLPTGRDRLLDAIRGFALVVIVIDHFDVNVLAQFTPQMFGFSDMADLFVLVSGISCGIAYNRRLTRDGFGRAQQRAFSRAGVLYAAYLLTMVAIIPLTWIYAGHVPAFAEFLDPQSKDLNLWKVVLMTHSWGALPILKVYMICVIATPGLVALGRRSPALVLCASAVLYAIVQVYAQYGYTWSYDELFVNPLAWQFLFVIGLATGAFTSGWRWAGRDWRAVLAAALILQIAFAVKTLYSGNVPGAGKVELGPLRILHVCSLLIVTSWVESRPWGAVLVRSWPSRALQCLGREALFAFCVGAILVAAANCVLKMAAYSLAAQLICSVVAIAALGGLTWSFSRWQTGRRHRPAGEDARHSAPLTLAGEAPGEPAVQP